jgi:hypothetical protein
MRRLYARISIAAETDWVRRRTVMEVSEVEQTPMDGVPDS